MVLAKDVSVFNSEKKKTKLNYEKSFQVRDALDFLNRIWGFRGCVARHSRTQSRFHILRKQGNLRWGKRSLTRLTTTCFVDWFCSSFNFTRGVARGQIKFDHQPLFEKRACASPPSSDADWTQVSGRNRAWVAWVRIRKQIFVREHLLRRLKDRMHTLPKTVFRIQMSNKWSFQFFWRDICRVEKASMY